MPETFDRDIASGLEMQPNSQPRLVERKELEKIIKQRRSDGYGAAYRVSNNEDCCCGCLFVVVNGIHELVTDWDGSKARAKQTSDFNNEVDALGARLEETIPVIDMGLQKMRENVNDFMESLPEGSVAKKVVKEYDPACFCEPFELDNGVKAVLLRGEYKKHYNDLTHRGGNIEEVYTQSGVMVTSDGDFFEVELQGMSLAKDRGPKLGSAMEIREFVTEYRKGAAFLSELGVAVKRAKDDENGARLVPTDQLYFNKKHRLDIQKLDLENDAGDQKNLRDYLLTSQKRALIVGLSIGKKEMEKQMAKSQKTLFPEK